MPASWNRLLSVFKRIMPHVSSSRKGQGMKRGWRLVQTPSVSTSILGWKGKVGVVSENLLSMPTFESTYVYMYLCAHMFICIYTHILSAQAYALSVSTCT